MDDLTLDHFVDSLVGFLDAIDYKEDNPDACRKEISGNWRYVYAETVKYFMEPSIKATLSLDEKAITFAARNISRLTVYCWPKLPSQVMVPISIHFMFTHFLDDIVEDNHKDMETFTTDLCLGTAQQNPVWRILIAHLPKLMQHYGAFSQFNIFRSTLDYYQGCWIEEHHFQGFPGSTSYPLYLRRLGGLGDICAALLFPSAQFDEMAVFEEVTTVLAEMYPITSYVNDLFSFYKELLSPKARNPHDENNLVMNYRHVEGITLKQAFDRLANDALNGVRNMHSQFPAGSKQRTPAVTEAVQQFVQGYIRWHICDQKRYRLKELYGTCGELKNGTKFRRYCEIAWYAGGVDAEDRWLVAAGTLDTKVNNLSFSGRLSKVTRHFARKDSKWSTVKMVIIAISSNLMLNFLQAYFVYCWWYGVPAFRLSTR